MQAVECPKCGFRFISTNNCQDCLDKCAKCGWAFDSRNYANMKDCNTCNDTACTTYSSDMTHVKPGLWHFWEKPADDTDKKYEEMDAYIKI